MPTRLRNLKSLRSKVNYKRYYKNIKYPEIPLSANDIYIITTVGDRLDTLAHQFYKDVDYWWIISTANPGIIRRDSFNLKPGLEIRIPQNILPIFNELKNLNK